MVPSQGTNEASAQTLLEDQGQIVRCPGATPTCETQGYHSKPSHVSSSFSPVRPTYAYLKLRMDSLDRSLQGGALGCWSQMIETQRELAWVEIDMCNFSCQLKMGRRLISTFYMTRIGQLFNFTDDAVSAAARQIAMIRDLEHCIECVETEWKKVWNRNGEVIVRNILSIFCRIIHDEHQPGSDAVLWRLLAPIAVELVGNPEQRITPYNVGLRDELWRVLREVSDTFPAAPDVEPERRTLVSQVMSRFKAHSEQDLIRNRNTLSARLDYLRKLALRQPVSDWKFEIQRPILLIRSFLSKHLVRTWLSCESWGVEASSWCSTEVRSFCNCAISFPYQPSREL